MNTIVVPVDFSAVSLNAVQFATDLALSKGASMVLFNTYQIPLTFTEVPVVAVTVEELSEISRSRLSELQNSLEHITSGRLKIYVESRLGGVVEELDDFCQKLRPSAVVMGSAGHGRLHELFIGGNTSEAMNKIRFPLIIVPPGARFKKPMNVGLACDMNEIVETLPSERIHEVIGWFGSNLYVLNVTPEAVSMNEDLNAESLMADTLLADLKPTYRFLEEDDVRDGVQSFAETHNLDWLLVIPKKHRNFSLLLKRSVSRDLAFHTHIPIVCLPVQ